MDEFYKQKCIDYIDNLEKNVSNDGERSKVLNSKNLVNTSKTEMDSIIKGFISSILGVDLFTSMFAPIDQKQIINSMIMFT